MKTENDTNIPTNPKKNITFSTLTKLQPSYFIRNKRMLYYPYFSETIQLCRTIRPFWKPFPNFAVFSKIVYWKKTCSGLFWTKYWCLGTMKIRFILCWDFFADGWRFRFAYLVWVRVVKTMISSFKSDVFGYPVWH